MHTARLLIGFALVCAPALCLAQESSTGGTLTERLAILAEGAVPLKDLTVSDDVRASWTAEVKRYAERRNDLRERCHDEIRKANRDTITSKAAVCLRSDLLLEVSHRRKQRDLLELTPGIDSPTFAGAMDAIDAWIDAAGSVIDGIDAGVFTTIDTLKEAKRNLQQMYRQPMLHALTATRLSVVTSLLRSLARATQETAATMDDPESLLTQVVPCLEEASSREALRSIISALRTCTDLLETITTP